MSSSQVKRCLESIKTVPSVKWVFFEGGEPTLYFPLLMEALHAAGEMGLNTAITTNGYWITSVRDMIPWLRMFRDVKLKLLQISIDELHENLRLEPLQEDIRAAAEQAGLLCEFIGVSVPEPNAEPVEARRGEPITGGNIVFRGRAAYRLVAPQATWLWSSFDECPHENLRDPYRIHIEPYGNIMICDGISIGSMKDGDLKTLLEKYVPEEHPIAGPIMEGGPSRLVKEFNLEHEEGYVDACHLCYEMRSLLLDKFESELAPKFLYGNRSAKSRGGRGNGNAGGGGNRRGGRSMGNRRGRGSGRSGNRRRGPAEGSSEDRSKENSANEIIDPREKEVDAERPE